MFTVAEIWKQPKCPSTDDWHKRICTHTHTHILVLVFVLSHSVVSNSLWPPWSVAPTRLLCPWGFSILQARILEWLQCCPPGNLPNPGIKPRSPAFQADSSLTEPLRSILQRKGKNWKKKKKKRKLSHLKYFNYQVKGSYGKSEKDKIFIEAYDLRSGMK